VRRTNAVLPLAARIERFVLLYKELDADDDEMTRTRKVRRRVIAERYADIIVPTGGYNLVAIDLLLTLIRSLARP